MMEKPFAITLEIGSSLANKTGSWRTERPVYVDRLPPCNNACPAGENIQQWLYLAEDGSYEAAWREIMRANPFPAVMGRACFHPCQTACNRATVDETVGINAIERFLGDRAIAEGWLPDRVAPPSGKRVLVVGSGPGGMTASYHLALLGHEVVVHESSPLPGGMMRYGIPAYRLPRDVVAAEIDRIVAMGVTMECERPVEDLAATMKDGGFDAAFMAVGAQRGRHADIPAGDSARILDAVSPPAGHRERRGASRWAAGWWSTAAGTRQWTPPARPGAWVPRMPSSSTGAPRSACPPTSRRFTMRWRRGCGFRWLSTVVDDDERRADH